MDSNHTDDHVTNSMDMNPYWNASSSPDGQEILRRLWNPNAHYIVHKSPQLVHIPRKINSVHTILMLLPLSQF
jgi:hypothetical protein